MENRFGVKDFVLFALVIVLIGVVLLAMVQYDRQTDRLQALVKAQDQQSADLASIRASLKAITSGRVAMASPTTGSATDPGDPFPRVTAAADMPDYAPGDTYIGTGPNTNKLTALLAHESFASDVQGYVMQPLIARDPVTLEWTPILAMPGWKVVDNSAAYEAYQNGHPTTMPDTPGADSTPDPNAPSPVSVTYRIRPNATFSDGKPVTADDVVWTFNWIMNPKVDVPWLKGAYNKIRKVYKTGADGVTFEFGEPYFDYLGLSGGMDVLPKHVYGEYSPEDFDKLVGKLVGSGPYVLANDWTPGKEIILTANDHYWATKPAIRTLRFRIIVEDLVRLTAFKNGEIDQLNPNPVQYESLLKSPDVVARTQHFEYSRANAPYRFIAWNQVRNDAKTRFADKRVRRAMTMLSDRDRICKELLLGYAETVSGPFNRLGKQADPTIKPWPFDVARAKALLAEAGYTDDGQGSLRDADGQPFAFKLTYPSGSPLTDRMVLFLKDTYAQAGVTLTPDPLDWSVFQDRLKNHDFDAIMLGWTSGLENDVYQMFDSKQIAGGGDDFMSYKNPDLDALLEKARTTIDESARMAMWHKVHAILHEDQPYTFMTTSKSLVFLDKRFANVQKLPLGLNDTTEWFVPTKAQKYKQ